MANRGRKGDIFVGRFRSQRKEFKKSLKVRDQAEAEAARRLVGVTLHRLLTGHRQVPPGFDPGDFIVSGGTLTKAVPKRVDVRPIRDLVQDYLGAQATYLAPSTHGLFTILNHWLRHLRGTAAREAGVVSHADLEGFLRARVAATSEATAAKERRTLIQFFRWAVAQGHLADSPAPALPVFKWGRGPAAVPDIGRGTGHCRSGRPVGSRSAGRMGVYLSVPARDRGLAPDGPVVWLVLRRAMRATSPDSGGGGGLEIRGAT